MKTLNALLIIVCASLLMSACSSENDDSTNSTVAQKSTLNWQSCNDQSNLQCTTLEVPMDPNDTDSDTISIALNRLASTQTTREGIVLLNPGGPGGSGVELLEELSSAGTLPTSLREKYDFIGFDPRGVGSSAAVDCSEFGNTEINVYLDSEQAIDQFVENQVSSSTLCAQKYGSYLQQLGSQNVVHDMDAIRNAAGEDKIHFIGYSYGTRLGALYLQTYPENSGHFVLDASLKPESAVSFLIEGAVEAMQESLESLLNECGFISPDCTGPVLLENLENKIATLESDGNEEDLNILAVLLYFAAENPELGPFLLTPLYEYLQSDDIAPLRDIYDNALDDLVDDGDDTLERAVMCADDPTRPTANDLNALLSQYNQLSDVYAEIHLSQAGMCSGWPESLHAVPPITTNQAPAALVIGGTTDTLTPVLWAEEMAQSISGYYLESNHVGHTSAFVEASTCVDAIAEAFLLTGLQPTETVCQFEEMN